MKHSPPRLAERFLLLFLKDELAEEVLGDLDEKFYTEIHRKSLWRARLIYWYQVIHYLRPFAFRYFRSNSIILTMLQHNFRVSYRILLKNKSFSAINIGGLAIGMVISILIGLWIYDELSYNKYHDNYDRIVQVYRRDFNFDGNIFVNQSMVGQAGVYLDTNYPDLFEHVVMTFFRSRPQLLTVDKKSFDQFGYFFQPDAPHMLTLQMVTGSRAGLKDRKGILLSQSLATTFFGDENPIGRLVNINLQADLEVTGVYQDLPGNSEFADASFIASLELIYNERNPFVWDNYNIRIYAQLKDGVELSTASAAIKELMADHHDPEDGRMELFLVPMKDWHLYASYKNGYPVESQQLKFVKLYAIIGLFVLLLACINFMNLNTARYQNRSKEVGIRKTVGSSRSQLISQFLAESILYAAAAFVLSLVLVWFLLPWFSGISDKSLIFPWDQPLFWGMGIVFTIVSALVAGSYPALLLSSFGPIRALRGTLKIGIGGVRLRQTLVIFQFTISILLIIGTITVHNQIQYAKTRPVGYNQEGLISLRGRSERFYEKYDVLREELKRTGVVTELATANYPLMNTLGNNGGFSVLETGDRIPFSFNTIFVTPEYGATTQWQLVAGRDFSRELADESSSIILSESAVQRIGLENPVGAVLEAAGEFNGHKRLTVIGVVKDMIKGSPFGEPVPLMVFANDRPSSFLFIRVKPNVPYLTALPAIQEAFESVLPDDPFSYEFVDDAYMTKFRAEEKVSSLATLFSVLAVLISCMGLFGLSAFVVEQRTKEIGIRKVLGASAVTLWRLLSRDFAVLVLIACMLAIPIAVYFLESWLDGYQYRISLSWWVFAIASLMGLLITLATVSIHSLRASFANPVESLRSE